jgi:hypothetical protein
MASFDQNQWRLGHRRPWWHWNVVTLFAAMFVLIWMRELFDVPFPHSLLLFGVLLCVWLYLPDFRLLLRELFGR